MLQLFNLSARILDFRFGLPLCALQTNRVRPVVARIPVKVPEYVLQRLLLLLVRRRHLFFCRQSNLAFSQTRVGAIALETKSLQIGCQFSNLILARLLARFQFPCPRGKHRALCNPSCSCAARL